MTYLIPLTADELNLIGVALGKLPYESVAGLVMKLRTEAQQQEATATQSADVGGKQYRPEDFLPTTPSEVSDKAA